MGEDAAIRDLILAELRCAVIRSKVFQCDCESVASALTANLIGPQAAIAWLRDCGADQRLDEIQREREAA